VPLLLLLGAMRWIYRRPLRTLLSVSGRLRWSWLATCMGLGLVALVLLLVVSALLRPFGHCGCGSQLAFQGWRTFLLTAPFLLVVFVVQIVTFELAYRGLVLQAFGWIASAPWLAIAAQAVLYAASLGDGLWGIVDLLVFGVLLGWVTVATGGLEAALGLMLAFQVPGVLLVAAYSPEILPDKQWTGAVAHAVAIGAYVLLAAWRAKRKGIARRAVEPMPASECTAPQVGANA
jgi:membrane protease YdiL (CAAX protease family)